MWMILTNWKESLLLGAAACLVLLFVLLKHAWTEVAEKTAVIDSMRREAQAYKDQSEATAKEINDAIPRMVEQAKKNAYANYLKKFGSNAACGIGAVRLPTQHGAGEAVSTERTDDPTSEFVVACAADAGRLKLWQDWAIANALPVE